MAKKLNVLIIGCGNIAGNFDNNLSKNSLPFSHAGAYKKSGKFKIRACVDPDLIKLKKFKDKWGIEKAYQSISEIDPRNKFDIVSICSPTKNHFYDLKLAIKLNPKLIFCEKPISFSYSQAKKIVNLCDKSRIFLLVNYSRRFDEDIQKFKNDIKNKKWGELRSVIGFYNKGIINNGTHLIDVLIYLLGNLKITKVGNCINDYSKDDPSIDVELKSESNIPIRLFCNSVNDFTFFEMQFVFSSGVIYMEQGGMFWRERKVQPSKTFVDYDVLSSGRIRKGRYPGAMINAINNIYDAIIKKKPIISSGYNALEAHKLCEKILKINKLK